MEEVIIKLMEIMKLSAVLPMKVLRFKESTAKAIKSQCVEALGTFVQEMQKWLGHTVTRVTEGSDSSSVGKGSIGYDKPIREVADIACRFVQQLKDNKENQHGSAPHGVSEDPPAQRDLRESTAKGTNGQKTEVLAMSYR